jgi:flagellar biosynthetic protein FlhB
MGLFDDTDEEQRTEEATPRRRQEARDKGQVALSTELLAAVVLIGWFGTIATAGGTLAAELAGIVRAFVAELGRMGTEDLTLHGAAALITATTREIGWATIAMIAPLFALSLLLGYAQVGLALSPKALELDLQKLDPTRGFQRFFSLRTLTRTLLSFTKLVAIAAVVAATAWAQMDRIVVIGSMELGPALAALGHVAFRCTAAALAAILAIGVLDFFFQRRQFEKELRMTKQEVKEEARSSEGDPQVKARIRRVQRELAARRMMADVPKSTVVITNPTHYAVALTYDRKAPAETRGAPRVVAKGVDHVAQRIKEVAREAGVVVYENAPLARTLHARCEIGDEVPLELYQAVAEVLAYVYGLEEARQSLAT